MTSNPNSASQHRGRRQAPRLCYLLSNHQNMLYMLAAGMVMSPAGFRGKHYIDSLSVYPGWIPLFRKDRELPAAALEQATSERSHLLPCVAVLDLSELEGPVRMLSRDGRMRDLTSAAARKRPDDLALLVPAPLPTNLLVSINFRSDADRQAFESLADGVANVDLSAQRVEVTEELFAADPDMAWPLRSPQESLLDDGRDTIPAEGQALGGVLAMLYHTANCSALGLAAFQSVTEAAEPGGDQADLGGRSDRVGKNDGGQQTGDLIRNHPILAELPHWANGDGISGQADARLFWGLVQALVAAQTREHPLPAVDVALAYLKKKFEGQPERIPEPESRPDLERLIADIRGLQGLGGGTVTELLERHPNPVSRSILLFCLRSQYTELLEFSHPLLDDAGQVLAAILSGACHGWLQIPRELRNPALSDYVAWRMTAAEHRRRATALAITAPPRPQPLRELFSPAGGEWSTTQREVAADLASQYHWDDCFQTWITLAADPVADALPEPFTHNGSRLLIPGRIKQVKEEVIEQQFLRRLGQWPPIAPELESRAREQLARAAE